MNLIIIYLSSIPFKNEVILFFDVNLSKSRFHWPIILVKVYFSFYFMIYVDLGILKILINNFIF